MNPETVWSIISFGLLGLMFFGVFKIIDWARNTRKAAEEAREAAREALAAAKDH